MAGVTFSAVTKVYSDGTQAVADMSLVVADGEFVVPRRRARRRAPGDHPLSTTTL